MIASAGRGLDRPAQPGKDATTMGGFTAGPERPAYRAARPIVLLLLVGAAFLTGCAGDTPSATDLPECSGSAAPPCLEFQGGELQVIVLASDGQRVAIPPSDWPPVGDAGVCSDNVGSYSC